MKATATTPLGRVCLALREAQDASDKLTAYLALRQDAGRYIRTIACDLSEALALAEASLMAAQPGLNSHEITLDEKPKSSENLWLDLGGGSRT